MTRAQFSSAINADEKWVQNSARLLNRTLRYTPAEARWMGLVRVLMHELQLSLARAGEIADKAMQLPLDARSVNAEETASGSAAIVLDMARYHSSHAATLSAALNLVEPGRPGRPWMRIRPTSDKSTTLLRAARIYGVDLMALRAGRPDSHDKRLRRLDGIGSMLVELTSADVRFVVTGGVAAAAHGSRRVTDVLSMCYDTSPSNVSRLARLLKKWNAYPRGIETGLPFFMDERQFGATPAMTLTTSEGFIDVLDVLEGIGAHDECRARSMGIKAFDIRFRVLDLAALIDAKRAGGRPSDLDQLPELLALQALA